MVEEPFRMEYSYLTVGLNVLLKAFYLDLYKDLF